MRQTKDYNCGVFALGYLLKSRGNGYFNPEILEKDLGCTEDSGTSHEGIINYLLSKSISFVIKKNDLTDLPLLVNYQNYGDGHYSVIVHKNEGLLWLYDPATGDIEMWREEGFREEWYSKRYGKEWGLYLNDQ